MRKTDTADFHEIRLSSGGHGSGATTIGVAPRFAAMRELTRGASHCRRGNCLTDLSVYLAHPRQTGLVDELQPRSAGLLLRPRLYLGKWLSISSQRTTDF